MLKIFVYIFRKMFQDQSFGQITYGQIKSVPWGVEQFFLASDPDVQTGLTQMRQIAKIKDLLSDPEFLPEAKEILVVLNGPMEHLMLDGKGDIPNRKVEVVYHKSIVILDL